MIEVRKLVAVELTFLGPKIVFAEYGFAVVAGAVLGLLSLRAGLWRTHAMRQVPLGIYLFFLALTYLVLLFEAIAMAGRGDCREELGDETEDTGAAFRKYRRQSLWLLVPIAVPVAWTLQRKDA